MSDNKAVTLCVLFVMLCIVACVAIANVTDNLPTFTQQAESACYPFPPVTVNEHDGTLTCAGVQH